MNYEAWLDELIAGDTRATAAKKAGYAQSTLSRQLERDYLRPEMVIALCRGYGRSPVTGLIETGYLQKWETEGVSVPYALEQATNKQILDEIMRRSDPEARELFGGAGHENEVVGLAPVEEFNPRSNNSAPVSDPSATDIDDGTVLEWDDSWEHAAYSGPNETEERLRRGEDPVD